MRKTFALFLLLLPLCLGLAGVEPQVTAEDPLIAKARHLLEALNAQDYRAAVRDFDATMLQVAGPEKLAEFWKASPGMFGAFKKQGDAHLDQMGAYDVVMITCEFEKMTLNARVVFDKEKHIAGFQFLPPSPQIDYKPPAYSSPDLFEEKEITVGGNEWPLPGTLTVPKGNGPFPALVLVHGSGPNDRDESLGPNKPFKDLAWGLASKGIAVLRYEKRTRVFGAKIMGDPKSAASLTVREETIEDALSAVKLLKTEKSINPKKIFVLGHSLGGMLIPRIAQDGKDLEITGYIIMAGLTRKIEDTILEQTNYLFGLSASPDEDEKKQIAEIKDAVEKIKALKKTDPQSPDIILMAPASYWLDLNEYEPVKLVKEITQPLLVLHGERDYQVTTVDFENWKNALTDKKNADFKLYPTLNHLFSEGEGKATPDEYMEIHKNIAGFVIDDIAGWVKKN